MTPSAEKDLDARIERYHALLEREYLGRLTAAEAEEMERVGLEIDRSFDWFYLPIIARLEAELAEKRKAMGEERDGHDPSPARR